MLLMPQPHHELAFSAVAYQSIIDHQSQVKVSSTDKVLYRHLVAAQWIPTLRIQNQASKRSALSPSQVSFVEIAANADPMTAELTATGQKPTQRTTYPKATTSTHLNPAPASVAAPVATIPTKMAISHPCLNPLGAWNIKPTLSDKHQPP